jgi:hypothetical protein
MVVYVAKIIFHIQSLIKKKKISSLQCIIFLAVLQPWYKHYVHMDVDSSSVVSWYST